MGRQPGRHLRERKRAKGRTGCGTKRQASPPEPSGCSASRWKAWQGIRSVRDEGQLLQTVSGGAIDRSGQGGDPHAEAETTRDKGARGRTDQLLRSRDGGMRTRRERARTIDLW